ncbi:hypothetical protein RZS08_04850, partial [Arthrospira platensis SPKY1]|nr:hypothetical protein [Arthrospira platensis SPKY1]
MRQGQHGQHRQQADEAENQHLAEAISQPAPQSGREEGGHATHQIDQGYLVLPQTDVGGGVDGDV